MMVFTEGDYRTGLRGGADLTRRRGGEEKTGETRALLRFLKALRPRPHIRGAAK